MRAFLARALWPLALSLALGDDAAQAQAHPGGVWPLWLHAGEMYFGLPALREGRWWREARARCAVSLAPRIRYPRRGRWS